MIQKIIIFSKEQMTQFHRIGKIPFFVKKIFTLRRMFIYFIVHLPFYFVAIPVVLVIRLIRPWLLIRYEFLFSDRIGHLVTVTELYLCERDAGINVPGKRRYIDFFYLQCKPISNDYVVSMWKRSLFVLPEVILAPVKRINRLLPGWEIHEIGKNTAKDRDVYNLLMRYPVHLKFTIEEEEKGVKKMREFGIPDGAPFVCLLARDNRYLKNQFPGRDWDYHNYRDVDIDNYVMAIEELVRRGYFVIRMGVTVNKPLTINHPNVIDYAWKGLRSEFMDIYLGAKCDFCISTHSGWDAVPNTFRKPIVFTNIAPLGVLFTFRGNYITIPKKYRDIKDNRILSVKEIFNHNLGYLFFASDFVNNEIELIENSPEEICDVVIEMIERLHGTWKTTEEDEELQARFFEVFPVNTKSSNGHPFYGKIYGRIGANYLRNNRWWIK